MLSAGFNGLVEGNLVENCICSFPVASYIGMTGPQVMLNGARVEARAIHAMGDRFVVVSAKAMARPSGVGLLVFLDGMETYREGIT